MLRVLVVDDEQPFREITCKTLRLLGWLADDAPDGDRAIQILENSPSLYDAVVLDRAMPGQTGDDVVRRLGSRKEFFDTCFVMATYYDSAVSAISALKLGVFEYLFKPFQTETLDSVLRAGVAWHRAHKVRHDLLKSLDRTRIVDRARKLLEEALGSGRVQLTLVNETGPPELSPLISRFRAGEEVVLETDRQVVPPLTRDHPTVGPMIAVPIRGSGNDVRGILCIETGSASAFSRSWIDVLRYFADMVGIALELGSDFEKLQDMYREWRHKIATNVQIVAMQARHLQKVSLSSPQETPESLTERVRFIADNAAVIEAFAQDIKAFAAEPGQPVIECVDAAEAVRAAKAEQEPTLKAAKIDVDIERGSGPTVLQADRDWLSYSLRCLIRNAIESIVEARRERTVDATDKIVLTIGASESHVEIRVGDTGIGFDEETRRQIFKPLFSTKAAALPESSAGESKGAERVERVLGLMSRWVTQDPHSQGIPNDLGRGLDLLVRDGDVVEMFVGHRARGGLDTARLPETSLCRVALDSPLAPEWRGRGEGLYTVQKYMSRLGGYVSASSEGWDKGAEFRISLPRSM